jgi:hypothetical protein
MSDKKQGKQDSLEYKYLYIEDCLPNLPKVDEEDTNDDQRGVVIIDMFENTEVDSH